MFSSLQLVTRHRLESLLFEFSSCKPQILPPEQLAGIVCLKRSKLPPNNTARLTVKGIAYSLSSLQCL